MRDEMRAYLDAPTNRLGTHCEKWDGLKRYYGRSDLIAMWVADMDFRTVPQVRQALVDRAEHAIYGYTDNTEEEHQAEMGWLLRRHSLKIKEEWMLYSPGVVDSLHFCVNALTQAQDKVLIQPPVYGPFFDSVEMFGRKLVKSPLIKDESYSWRMNFDDMELAFKSGVKLMLLCNPHNPTGRVWKREELQKLVNLANRYGVIVVSDEIHAEFTFDGHSQTRIISLQDTDNCIMLTSATKAFNLAGLRHSTIIVPNPRLRNALKSEIARAHAMSPNIFGSVAQTAAYKYGDEWMDAVVEYVHENRDYAFEFIENELPQIGCCPQEGTYLMWLDCNGTYITHEKMMDLLINRAHVAVNSGLFFGDEGRGYFRLNLATQRINLEAALNNICEMMRSR